MTEWTEGVFAVDDFDLERGGTLPRAELAYLCAGTLAPDGSNAVLVTHGYTSAHHFVMPDSLASEGSWSALVGPGRAIDTDRHFVVSSNALGSCYGSSGPASTNPATGQPWGEDFPEVTLRDSVRMQRRLLDSLGVRRLHAVAGPSMGGMQALLWGVEYPEHVDRLVVAVSDLAPPATHDEAFRERLVASIRSEPGWNRGRFSPGTMVRWLTAARLATLRQYSMDAFLRDQGIAEDRLDLEMEDLARRWADGFHPWSMVSLGRAIAAYGVEADLPRMRARVLLALCDTDLVFPAASAPGILRSLDEAGVRARYVEITSRYGHLASGIDWRVWEGALRDFLAA